MSWDTESVLERQGYNGQWAQSTVSTEQVYLEKPKCMIKPENLRPFHCMLVA